MGSDRFYKLNSRIQARPGIRLQDIMSGLQVSRETAKRDIETLRDRFGTPIVYDCDVGEYRLDLAQLCQGAMVAQLPCMWLSLVKAYALLIAQQLLSTLEPDLLGPRLNPLAEKLNKMLSFSGHSVEAIQTRIKVSSADKRRLKLGAIRAAAATTLRRKRLRFSHYNSQNDERSDSNDVLWMCTYPVALCKGRI